MKRIIIIGGKGTAVNVAEAIIDAAENYNQEVEFFGFAFDDDSFNGKINDYPILCKTTEAYQKFGHLDDVFFIFQMNNQNKMKERAKLIDSYNIPSHKWFTFIHPTAFVSRSVKIGFGTVIYTHCAIHSNAIIGNHCTLSALTTIGHDTKVEDNVFMATHVCVGSSVIIEKCNFIGQNVSISTSVTISQNNLFGIGTCVTKKIPESGKIFIGSPAKILKDI